MIRGMDNTKIKKKPWKTTMERDIIHRGKILDLEKDNYDHKLKKKEKIAFHEGTT